MAFWTLDAASDWLCKRCADYGDSADVWNGVATGREQKDKDGKWWSSPT